MTSTTRSPPSTPRPSVRQGSTSSAVAGSSRSQPPSSAPRRASGMASAGGAAAAGATPTKGDRDSRGAMDLDSPNFNPKLYYQDLIERSSLADLLKVQAELAKEIRQLDQEKHDLIYGRHHDLVAASSTIQRMNASTSPLSDSLDSLRDAWSTISQLVESLSLPTPSASATASSSTPAQTIEVSLLTREIAELPQHLSDLLLLGRTDEARTSWEAKRPVLAKWVESGVKGAESVERECTEVLAEAGEVRS